MIPTLGRTEAMAEAAGRVRALVSVDRGIGGAAGLGVFILIASTVFAHGAYYPTAWGWTALLLSWIATVALLFRARVILGRPGAAFLLGLAAFVGWILLSTLWSHNPSQTIPEAERAIVYVAAVLALFAVRPPLTMMLGAALAACTLVSAYGLATRLFPERLGIFDPLAGYRLSEPIGYWNALGITAAIGALLACGFAARGESRRTRALAACALPLLVTTIYFTFSRGAWVAVAVGLLGTLALDRRPLGLVTRVLALAPPVGAALWFAHASDALTRRTARISEASQQGHRLALIILSLGLVSGGVTLLVSSVQSRFTVSATLRRGYAAALILLLAGAVAAVFTTVASPAELVRGARRSFGSPVAPLPVDLNRHLFSLRGSGRGDFWRVAWDDFERHPWGGSGAGSYEQYWLRHRPNDYDVRDAHSLYAEVLAELGPVGLGLIALVLGSPLVASAKIRGRPVATIAGGAYLAYVVHAGLDWDWEVPAVTLLALAVGASLVIAGTPVAESGPERLRGWRVVWLPMLGATAAVALVGLIGNTALAAATRAAEDGRLTDAERKARTAARWAPWSARPWEVLGDIQFLSSRSAARASFRRAAEKEPDNWRLWLKLAYASPMPEKRAALARATALNPRSPEVAAYRTAISESRSMP